MKLNISNKSPFLFSRWLILPALTALVSCGGGTNNNVTDTIEITGSVFAAAVSEAICEIQDNGGNSIGDGFTTNSNGEFVVTIPTSASASSLSLICDGGSFQDEATGELTSAGKMAVHIAGGFSDENTSAQLTPASTIVHALVHTHDLSVETATEYFKLAFGYEPDINNQPHDATKVFDGDMTTTLEHRRSGLRAASFSQLTKDLGLAAIDQFPLYKSLAEDLADGKLDGKGVNGFLALQNSRDSKEVYLDESIENQFTQAMVNFRDSGKDKSGLENAQIGVLVFSEFAATENYRVKYVPDMHGAVNGKTQFTLNISNAEGHTQTGLAVMIEPTMNMSGKQHTTAYKKQCTEMNEGEYHCTVYYVMPSVMMNGMSMGYWSLEVMIEGEVTETAIFYPTVNMAMGDTVLVKLKGVQDKIPAMTSQQHSDMPSKVETYASMGVNAESRTYFLFNEALVNVDGNYDFEMFIAAKENMMSFPAIATNQTLNEGHMHYTLTLTDIIVEVSLDTMTWFDAVEQDTAGHWKVTGLQGLSDNEQNKFYVKLTINEEQKTTDGKMLDSGSTSLEESNQFAQFLIKPNSSDMSM